MAPVEALELPKHYRIGGTRRSIMAPSIPAPLCREMPVSQIADISFSSQVVSLSDRGYNFFSVWYLTTIQSENWELGQTTYHLN